MSGMVGKTKGEPSRVGYMVWNGGGRRCGRDMTKRRRGDDHVIGYVGLGSVPVDQRDQIEARTECKLKKQVPGGRLMHPSIPGFDLLTATCNHHTLIPAIC